MKRREDIFYATIEVFKDRGMAFTMNDLARKLGISKRTLYENYPSKESIINMIIDETYNDVKKQQQDILSNNSLSYYEKLRKTLNIIPIYANFTDFRKTYEIYSVYPNLQDLMKERIRNDWDTTLYLLEKSMEEGSIKKYSLVIIKKLLCAVFESLLEGDIFLENDITYKEALEEMMNIIFDGLSAN